VGMKLYSVHGTLTYHSLPSAYRRDLQMKGWYRLIAVIQQRKANDIIRPVAVVRPSATSAGNAVDLSVLTRDG